MKYYCIKQHDITDCGAACLATICKQNGYKTGITQIREVAGTDKQGTNAYGVINAAEQLGLNHADLAAVIGVSEATISRFNSHARTIDPSSKEGELALMLIRVFRSLDPLVGGDEGKRKAWMSSYNKALVGQPNQLIRKADGLVRTLAYLDGMRAAS